MYLVTGGAGFLGKCLSEHILARKEQVRIIDMRTMNFPVPGVEYIRGDVTKMGEVELAVRGCSVIFNLVSLLPCSRAGRAFFRVNVLGTQNVLEAALKDNVRKIVHVSTSVVYGLPERVPLREDSGARPIGDYGRTKLLAERVCSEYIKRGLNISILRPRFIIGPGRLGLLTILFDWISKGKNIYIIGNGENRFQMVSVYDLVDACLKASEKGASTIYNIGADDVPKVKDLLSALLEHAGTGSKVIKTNAHIARFILTILSKFVLVPLGTEHYLIADKDYILDTSKAKRELGWLPKHSQIDMMVSAYDWYIANKDKACLELKSDFPEEKLLKILKCFS